jgi:hypothetical protein
MTHHRLPLAATIAAALLATATIASAQDLRAPSAVHPLGEHPAVLVKRQVPQIDPNTFILMHPAGLFVIAAPTQADDPSAVARKAVPRGDLSAAAAVSASEH